MLTVSWLRMRTFTRPDSNSSGRPPATSRPWNALLLAGMRSATSVLQPLSKHERMSDFSAQSTSNDLDQENLEPCVRPNMRQGQGLAPHSARE